MKRLQITLAKRFKGDTARAVMWGSLCLYVGPAGPAQRAYNVAKCLLRDLSREGHLKDLKYETR